MSRQFDEAPPLPREPTALNVPRAMGTVPSEDPVSVLPVDAYALPPPPRFPSLTDVALPSATAAAASLDSPSSTVPPASDTSSRPTSSQLAADIDEVLGRDAIVPGTGAKKAMELGQNMWTENDQKELEKLLEEGRDVFVPPDITVDDIASTHSRYVLVPSENVDSTVEERSVAERVAAWNCIMHTDKSDEEDTPIPFVPVPGNTVEDATSRSVDEPEDKHATRDLEEQKEVDISNPSTGPAEGVEGSTSPGPVDVTTTIFGAQFLSVPVISRKAPILPAAQPDLEVETTEIIETTPTDIELRMDSAAHINVTDDYGLKGGHATGVNDAAFLNNGTLITCGDDGKVCIWDMEERAVESEFVPYSGEGVTMVYPMPDEQGATSVTLMTLSSTRVMRIWSVETRQAILLRSSQIKQSDKALYMSVPHISKELKARAAAAAAAAAVTTTDDPDMPVQIGTASASAAATPVTPAVDVKSAEEEKDKKRFSFTKVLSFGRNTGARKAVAS